MVWSFSPKILGIEPETFCIQTRHSGTNAWFPHQVGVGGKDLFQHLVMLGSKSSSAYTSSEIIPKQNKKKWQWCLSWVKDSHLRNRWSGLFPNRFPVTISLSFFVIVKSWTAFHVRRSWHLASRPAVRHLSCTLDLWLHSSSERGEKITWNKTMLPSTSLIPKPTGATVLIILLALLVHSRLLFFLGDFSCFLFSSYLKTILENIDCTFWIFSLLHTCSSLFISFCSISASPSLLYPVQLDLPLTFCRRWISNKFKGKESSTGKTSEGHLGKLEELEKK